MVLVTLIFRNSLGKYIHCCLKVQRNIFDLGNHLSPKISAE